MITILTGIAASIAAELVTWLNAKLSGTVLQGDAAFILAAVIAVVASLVQIYLWPVASFQAFLLQASAVWASSQVFFLVVVQYFGLTVKPAAPQQLG